MRRRGGRERVRRRRVGYMEGGWEWIMGFWSCRRNVMGWSVNRGFGAGE